jgi:ADP-heptose:LPS heptosyltransferase
MATERVLLYRLGSLGDMVVALPALHLVERAFPDAERRLLTNEPVSSKAAPAEAVLGGAGLVQGFLRYPAGTRSLWQLARLWWTLWRWRPQVLVYLAGARGVAAARRDAKFFRLCGVRRLVGVPLTEAMQQNFYGAERSAGYDAGLFDGDLEPEAERLVRCLSELGTADVSDAASWELRLSAAERAAADAAIGSEALALGPMAVSVGTKVQAKDWGKENWRALLGRIAGELRERGEDGRALLLVGAAEEAEASEFAAADWRAQGGGPVVNLCGQLTPRESAAALARAEIFLGHDSGPMHLAAAVGTPCVAVFAARNLPRQWFPAGPQHRVVYHRVDCAGCGLETCIVEGKKCLAGIGVEEVFQVVCSRLLVVGKDEAAGEDDPNVRALRG